MAKTIYGRAKEGVRCRFRMIGVADSEVDD